MRNRLISGRVIAPPAVSAARGHLTILAQITAWLLKLQDLLDEPVVVVITCSDNHVTPIHSIVTNILDYESLVIPRRPKAVAGFKIYPCSSIIGCCPWESLIIPSERGMGSQR